MFRTFRQLTLVSAFLLAGIAKPARADTTEVVVLHAQTMTAHAANNLSRIVWGDGVRKVTLDKPAIGQITVVAAPGKSLNYDAIRRALRSAGFVAHYAKLTDSGGFARYEGKPVFYARAESSKKAPAELSE